MFSIASSNLIPDHAAVFVVGLDDKGCVFRYARGIGVGRELAGLDPGGCRLEQSLTTYDEVMGAAAEHLRRWLAPVLAEEPFASVLAESAARHPDRHGALGIYLVGDDDEAALEALSDFAIANLATVALADLDTLNVSSARDEVATMEICSASPVGIFIAPELCQVVTVKPVETCSPGDTRPIFLEDATDRTVWWVLPIRLGIEWRGTAPDIPGLARLREIDLPEDQTIEAGRLKLVGDIVARISDWFWESLSPSLDDPFVRIDRDMLHLLATRAPMTLVGCDEDGLGRLIDWVVLLDLAADDAEKVSATTEDEERRLGFFRAALGVGTAQTIEIAAAHLGKPAVVANYMPMTQRMRAVLQEVLAYASPRGSSVGLYATNRESSALYGPARRFYSYGHHTPSAHALIEATAGLEGFLASRGYQEDEIRALLSPEVADPCRAVEDFGA